MAMTAVHCCKFGTVRGTIMVVAVKGVSWRVLPARICRLSTQSAETTGFGTKLEKGEEDNKFEATTDKY